jgi:hypothetical protein
MRCSMLDVAEHVAQVLLGELGHAAARGGGYLTWAQLHGALTVYGATGFPRHMQMSPGLRPGDPDRRPVALSTSL